MSGDVDGFLSIFELGRPKGERFTKLLTSFQGRPNCRLVAWRDSNRELITANEDGNVTIWSAKDGHPIFVLPAHAGSAITQILWL